jgi:hypothetical protein
VVRTKSAAALLDAVIPPHPPPSPPQGAGSRVFYETLYAEKPKSYVPPLPRPAASFQVPRVRCPPSLLRSDLALVWLIEHGCFSQEKHSELAGEYEKARIRLAARK